MTFQTHETLPPVPDIDEWLDSFVPPEEVTIDGRQYPYAAIARLTGMGRGGHEPHDLTRIRASGALYSTAVLHTLETVVYDDGHDSTVMAVGPAAAPSVTPSTEVARDPMSYSDDELMAERERIALLTVRNIELAEYRTRQIEQGLPFDGYPALQVVPAVADVMRDGIVPPLGTLSA